MRSTTLLLILIFTLTLPFNASAAGPVQLHYTADVTQPARRLIRIQVRIEGLPEGRTNIVFPDSGSSVPNRISRIGWLSENGEVSPLTLEDGQFVVESSGEDPVTLAFQLRSETYSQLDRATYVDETRCVFHPQDVWLQLENQDPKATLSFTLPESWEAISTAHPAMAGSFSLATKRLAPFYLGKAERVQDDVNSPITIAVEPGAIPAPELLVSLRQQVRHRQRFVRNQGPTPLLAVFLGQSRATLGKELDASGVPQLLALTVQNGPSESRFDTRKVRQGIVNSLVRMYFPVLSNFSDSLGPDRLIDYLTLKTCLKTGILGRDEFLDALAAELWNTFGDPTGLPAKPRPNTKSAHVPAVSQPGTRASGPLLDLALSLYGDTAGSLEAFLANGFASSTPGPITEADLRRRFRQEHQASAALAGLWKTEHPLQVGDLLRPFGLLFDRRELPAFDFQLNESFQVTQVSKTPGLEAGDRIVAINSHRFLLPDDLLKCRSRLTPGQEIQLDIERRNLQLKVTQRVAKEVLLKLQVNKLADADKQQKLEQFLSSESEGN